MVSDDTQMALAVARALVRAESMETASLEPLLREEFVTWANSEENTRAPGMTCMRALRSLVASVGSVSVTV